MATYVLVHGAYHGGWCWRPVASRLRAAGHEVHAPTLTGLGERSHLLSSSVGLSTHITDVVQVIDFEGLDEVILVGHSYGGVVCSGVASRRPERIARLVNLDGPVAVAGESGSSIHPRGAEIRARVTVVDGIEVLPVPTNERMGIDDDAQLAWVLSKETPQPFLAVTEPLALEQPIPTAMPKVYILCQRNPSRERAYLARVDAAEGWTMLEIDSGHDAMVSAPDELSAMLCRLAIDDAVPAGSAATVGTAGGTGR